MPRHCQLCGEPVPDHELREPDAHDELRGRALSARHPSMTRAALVGGQLGRVKVGGQRSSLRDAEPLRVCPVIPVERARPDGSTYTAMVPRRRASRLELDLASRVGRPPQFGGR